VITKRQRLRLTRGMAGEKPTLWIGKNGVNEKVVVEVKKQLKRKEVIKVKVLKKALEESSMEALAKDLVDSTGAELIEARGHTLILYKVRLGNNCQGL